jgi:hypothetical protein
VTAVAGFPRRRDGWYYLDGGRYPSVTTILGVLNKPALVHWAARTAAALALEDPVKYNTAEAAAGGIYAMRDRAADRGVLVHSLAEAFARRATVDRDGLPVAVRGYADAFWAWVATTQPTPLFTESNVFNLTHGYAGTFDLLCAFPSGQLALLDLKTTKHVYDEASLQLAAYQNAEVIVPHTDAAQRIPMPPVGLTAVLLLADDGTFTYKVVNGDLEAFLAAKRLWAWTRGAKGVA